MVLPGERDLDTQKKPSALDGRSVVLPGESDLGTPTKPQALDGRSVVLPGERELGTQRKPPALDWHVLWSNRVKEIWVPNGYYQPWTRVL